jgi:hypothetical protein
MNNPTKKPNPRKRLVEGKPEFDVNKMRKLLKQVFYEDWVFWWDYSWLYIHSIYKYYE